MIILTVRNIKEDVSKPTLAFYILATLSLIDHATSVPLSDRDNQAPVLVKAKKAHVVLHLYSKLLKVIDNITTQSGISRNVIIAYWCSKGVESQ